jgi:hypothetical protein
MMRFLTGLLALSALGLGGCGAVIPLASIVTHPLDNNATFEEAQKRYTANIRYGLFEDALPFVEPELKPRFQESVQRFREIRFSDYRIESIDIDPERTHATVVVRYSGYWLSSPYEREILVVQQWRREVPTHDWFVTPDFATLLDPAGG